MEEFYFQMFNTLMPPCIFAPDPESVLLFPLLLRARRRRRPHVSRSPVGQRGGDLRLALAAGPAAVGGHPEAVRDLYLGRDVVPHELLHVVLHDEGRVALQWRDSTQQCVQPRNSNVHWKGCVNVALKVSFGNHGTFESNVMDGIRAVQLC